MEAMGYGQTFGLVLLACSSSALAGAPSQAASHPFETCLMTRALELERSGNEVSEVLAAAERSCRDARGDLSEMVAGQIQSRARIAVMQQRSNALNTRRRG